MSRQVQTMANTMSMMARTATASENDIKKMGIGLGHGFAYGCRLREKAVKWILTEVERRIC
jgi:hypothetical protein